MDVTKLKHITEAIKPEALNEILKLGEEQSNDIFEKLLNDPSVDLKALNRMMKNPEAIANIGQLLEKGGEHAL